MKNSTKTLLYWTFFFLALLIGIYSLLSFEYILAAKLTGVIIVLTFIIALKIWTTNSKIKNLKLKKTPLNLNHRYWLNEHCFFYQTLNSTDKIIFEDRIGLLLSKVGVVDTHKEVKADTFLAIMAYCTITFWNQPFWDLGRISTFINNDLQTFLNDTSIECSFSSISKAISNSVLSPMESDQSSQLDELQLVLIHSFKQENKH
jgi:hypothetical protein